MPGDGWRDERLALGIGIAVRSKEERLPFGCLLPTRSAHVRPRRRLTAGRSCAGPPAK